LKYLSWILVVAFFVLMVAASLALPIHGDMNAPAHRNLSAVGSLSAGAYYLENAYRETHTVNIVTAVLADYRAFDTLGETLVVFAAGVACTLILTGGKRDP
jgi:multicomponent Na+:H+ antiporter subunit B